MSSIFLSVQSKKREVIAFLEELKDFLGKEDFDIDSGLTLIKRKKQDDEEHSTPYTLLDLDYDAWDVVERLKELTIAEYSETKIDEGSDGISLRVTEAEKEVGRWRPAH